MPRPKKTTGQFPKAWKKLVIDEMMLGASKQEIKALLSILNDLWGRLMREDREFSETIKRGLILSEAWWMKQGRIYLTKPGLNATLWYMNMKNRFGWRDKPEEASNQSLRIPFLEGLIMKGDVVTQVEDDKKLLLGTTRVV